MDNKNVVQYMTAMYGSPQGLDQEINRLIENGWLLFGSPYYGENLYCQALVKYSNK